MGFLMLGVLLQDLQSPAMGLVLRMQKCLVSYPGLSKDGRLSGWNHSKVGVDNFFQFEKFVDTWIGFNYWYCVNGRYSIIA